MYGGYGTSPPLTNNPFIPDTNSHPSSRFPDISTPPTNPTQQQYASWGDGSMMNGEIAAYPQQQQGMYQQQQYPPQQQQFQTNMGYGQPQQPQMNMMGGGMVGGFVSPSSPSYPSPTGSSTSFQPSSSFGQQLAASRLSGSSYGYLQGQQQPQGNSNAYNPVQQQLQNNPGYIAQFDPYSSIAQGWDGSNAPNNTGGAGGAGGMGMAQSFSTGSTTSSSGFSGTGSSASGGGGGGSSYGVSATGDPHPRDFIRTHKAAIEAWDNYAWKQLIGAFEALMRSWETRKGELTKRAEELTVQLAHGGYYVAQIQQEGARLQGLHKEAQNNFDSVAASTFQMKEVFAGYRQSGDQASKARVREAMNASLQGLPGWPQPF